MDYTVSTIAPIFLFPFFAFVINAFLGRKLPKDGNWVSLIGILLSFVFSLRVFFDFMGKYDTNFYVHKVFNWFDLSVGDSVFKIDLGIYLDNMAVVMLLMVTGVASLIHIFSIWYMSGDRRHGRFFVFLSLFTSAMIGLVLANNLLLLFIFWEIMGFCSYSLIGIYYEKDKAGDASLKAFMTTRVGDVLFLLGILAIWAVIGSVDYVDIYKAIAEGTFESVTVMGIGMTTFAAFTIFCGNIGKSAQFPLQVWLPDAMMGPTPGSALIHAATMVAAGCYLSLRMYPLMEAGGLTPFIAFIGAITAFGAATIALVQKDLKAVLAYSTISQLGYMVLGIGVGSYNAAFMHVITHAIFKACLFMSAGSIIHSVHEQMMPKLGGLSKKLPITFLCMVACTLAISGVPFFTGFVSKDRILGDAIYWGMMAGQNKAFAIVPILGFLGAILTPFYMTRMMCLIFLGKPRDQHVYDHCHQEHFSLTQHLPLVILSIFTLGVFFSGALIGEWVPVFGAKQEWFKVLIEAPNVNNFVDTIKSSFGFSDSVTSSMSVTKATYTHQLGYFGPNPDEHGVHQAHFIGAILSIFLAIGSIIASYLVYVRGITDPNKWANTFAPVYRTLVNKYYFDDFYLGVVIQKGLLGFNKFLSWFDMGVYDRIFIDGWAKVNFFFVRLAGWFDDKVIDSLVDLNGIIVKIFNVIFRKLQTGRIQWYLVVMFFSLVFINYYFLL
ncbi:NADH-quinone oxidoreductase subunit L [Bacteriovoracaceae bacterium]|nr:NADH-quinone oxidoreductase subunit L [Bacteriovoracaceae bacterium]